ncbi:MAG: TIM barrel protein [Planctomycetaceae bacterium]|nr:TIM barrel protein [Planctomycetaceae bacterium]
MNNIISRRRLLKGAAFVPFLAGSASAFGQATPRSPVKGNIRQSVTYGTFRNIPLPELAKALLEMGIVGLDLVGPADWEAVQKAGLIVTLSSTPGGSIAEGFNHIENHDRLFTIFEDLIPRAEKAGVKQLICMSGNRKGKSDDEGIRNCIMGLKRMVPIAEKHGIMLVMELLNSLVNHADYHADRTSFGAEIVKGVGSENFKLLYDIYHMQIMEGNLIDTIRKNADVIGHYHTAGVPDRRDLDDQQEIYFPAVMRAIVESGFKGFVAHEFSPKKADRLESLRDAVKVCDV